jgi:flagellar biosynthesis protein
MDHSKTAVALKYDQRQDRAPRVVAKGKGRLAQKIMALAADNDIPTFQDDQLADLLEALDLENEIPSELYFAVAEVLVFVYELNRRAD